MSVFIFHVRCVIQLFLFATIGSLDTYDFCEERDDVYASHYHMTVKLAQNIAPHTRVFNVPGTFSSRLVTDFLCQVQRLSSRAGITHLHSHLLR